MPRLSILIPAVGSSERLEATLVSVLQNRPDDCEVVVAFRQAYDDPYALADEVRFTTAREARCGAELTAAALRLCRADVVHVLAAGVEVDDGWTEAALEHFLDERIAAVAPLVLRTRDEAAVCSTGVEYRRGGRRVRRGCGTTIDRVPNGVDDVLGPTYLAGFYRRAALAAVPHAFDPAVTDAFYDVDTALQLRSAGYRAVFEPRSIVYRQTANRNEDSAYAEGRGAERLFRRHRPQFNAVAAWTAHAAAVVGELFDRRPIGDKFRRLLGRLDGACRIGELRRFRCAVEHVGKPGLAYAVTTTGDRIRIDAAHPHTSTIVAPTKPAAKSDARGGDGSGRAA